MRTASFTCSERAATSGQIWVQTSALTISHARATRCPVVYTLTWQIINKTTATGCCATLSQAGHNKPILPELFTVDMGSDQIWRHGCFSNIWHNKFYFQMIWIASLIQNLHRIFLNLLVWFYIHHVVLTAILTWNQVMISMHISWTKPWSTYKLNKILKHLCVTFRWQDKTKFSWRVFPYLPSSTYFIITLISHDAVWQNAKTYKRRWWGLERC